MRTVLFLLICSIASAYGWQHKELVRFKADEAHQGVAVDEDHFYAITNHAIGKYRKETGRKVAVWNGDAKGRIKHLNAGIVLNGKLYCAHSNFPALPEESSVEIWDVATLRPVESRPLEKAPGSLTWVDQRDGVWFACFAHYSKTSDPAKSCVVQFDAQWHEQARWSFPPELIRRFAGNSCSGGSFGPEGLLFVTGHDAAELYVLELPSGGGELKWLATVPTTTAGQAFAWDRTREGVLYSIQRKTKEVVLSRITRTGRAWVTLFDGTTFTGWEHAGNWVIDDGAFHRQTNGGPLTYTAQAVPDDFELRFEWKVSKGCNSGVYYRPAQYEYQVLDNVNSPYGENPRQSAASLFFCMAPSKDCTKPVGEWNEGRVMCKGTVIQHWLNGEKVIDFDYTDPKWAKEVELLRIRGADLNARGGKLWLQDHGADVWFRNLKWRAIPADEQLARSEFVPMFIPAEALRKENERVEKMLKARDKQVATERVN